MRHNIAGLWGVTMLEQIDALPRPQRQTPLCYRNGQRHGHHRRFDVGGHVIWAFVCVGQIGHRRVRRGGNQTPEKCVQIGLHLRVGVLLDQQRTGCVLHKQRQQTGPCGPVRDVIREFIETRPMGLDGKLALHEPNLLRGAGQCDRIFGRLNLWRHRDQRRCWHCTGRSLGQRNDPVRQNWAVHRLGNEIECRELDVSLVQSANVGGRCSGGQ